MAHQIRGRPGLSSQRRASLSEAGWRDFEARDTALASLGMTVFRWYRWSLLPVQLRPVRELRRPRLGSGFWPFDIERDAVETNAPSRQIPREPSGRPNVRQLAAMRAGRRVPTTRRARRSWNVAGHRQEEHQEMPQSPSRVKMMSVVQWSRTALARGVYNCREQWSADGAGGAPHGRRGRWGPAWSPAWPGRYWLKNASPWPDRRMFQAIRWPFPPTPGRPGLAWTGHDLDSSSA